MLIAMADTIYFVYWWPAIPFILFSSHPLSVCRIITLFVSNSSLPSCHRMTHIKRHFNTNTIIIIQRLSYAQMYGRTFSGTLHNFDWLLSGQQWRIMILSSYRCYGSSNFELKRPMQKICVICRTRNCVLLFFVMVGPGQCVRQARSGLKKDSNLRIFFWTVAGPCVGFLTNYVHGVGNCKKTQ